MKPKQSRRKFLGQLSTASALTTFAAIPVRLGAELPPLTQDAEYGFVTPPYLQALEPTSVSIAFLTSGNGYSWVEYGETDLTQKAQEKQDGMVEAYKRLNVIKISGLKPATSYRYRIASKAISQFKPYDLQYGQEIKSETFVFTTPDPQAESVSCLLLNDIHDRPYSFKDLLSLPNIQPYEFVLLNGDMFDYQEDEQQIIEHLLAPCTELFASEIPFIMSRGNHETRGKYRREFRDYFAYPTNTYYYSFQQGPVYWVILDTGEDKPDNHPVYAGIVDFDGYREEQGKWLKRIAQEEAYKKAAYRVVVMHIPPFHSGDWHGPMHCREVFDPVFSDHHVDLVIAGHTHRYGVHPPDEEHRYPILIGGGPKEGNRTLIEFSANSQALNVIMRKDDGEEVGHYEIQASQ